MGNFLPASDRQKSVHTIERGDAGPGLDIQLSDLTESQREFLGLAPQIGKTGLEKTMEMLVASPNHPDEYSAIEQE